MPLHPQMQIFVDQMLEAGSPPDFAVIGVEASKAVATAMGQHMGQGPEVARVEDLTFPGPESEIAARLYVPEGSIIGLLIYLHGGGWVLGDISGYDACVRRLAVKSGCAVLSVDYRLAPDHPFPAPLDDCYAATCWAAANKARIGLADDTPLAIGGDSAGGNLAAAVALMARDQGGPALAAQMLLYPVTDADFSTPSHQEHTSGLPLVSSAMQWFWSNYIPSVAERLNPLASPLQAESLAGLPPAVLAIPGYDPLRSEVERYGERLKAENVSLSELRYDGLTHGFFQFAQILPVAGEALDEIAEKLAEMLLTPD
ncbi:alpha/beta hydrolase [Rhizorhabdus argentea]|uniref:alpha/beta hydrolase n=1 Tax=Rhizorhabdus argentea TaxID=1387174 RepID=UPI0030EED5EF